MITIANSILKVYSPKSPSILRFFEQENVFTMEYFISASF